MDLLYAMTMMVMLTALVGIIMLVTRITAVQSGTIQPGYFKLMKGPELPEVVTASSRNFSNQFEVPILFYVVSILYMVLDIENAAAIMLAWSFVASRIIHTAIHLTYNHVIHRMLVFLFGFVCVIALWINLVLLQP